MNWTKEKPVLNRKCILLTATKLRDRFEIEGYEVFAAGNGFGRFDYWGISDLNTGDEREDYGDLKVDFYLIIDYPKL